MAEGGEHGVFRQMVEKNTGDILLAVDLFGDMPGDGFAFPVGVGGEVDGIGPVCGRGLKPNGRVYCLQGRLWGGII
jgi:hypothetical protein